MSKNRTRDIKFKKVKLKYIYPDSLSTNFVSNLIVQHQKEFFTLSFFEAWVPPILGETQEEKKVEMDKIKQVDAKCVSRLIITPEKMREIVDILEDNLKNYDKTFLE